MQHRDTTLTARDLLYGFLDLQHMIPKFEDWSEDKYPENPPRLIRIRRLKAIFRAFEIKWDPLKFFIGDFLCSTGKSFDPVESRYCEFLQGLKDEMPRSIREVSKLRKMDLFNMFRVLMRYREALDRVLSSNRGVMAASGPGLYAIEKIGTVNQVIQKHVPVIDDLLIAIIDPEKRAFPMSRMVKDFGYPEEDLGGIDADWW